MDREDFESVAEALRPRLHRFCARMTRSVVIGEDLVQDTLARAYDRLDTLRDDDRVESWLFRIAYTQCLNERRERRFETLEAAEPEEAAEEGEDPVEREQELGAALRTLVTTLPTKERAAIILKDVLDCSLKDTAAIVDSTEGGVKAALHRARRKLREASPPEPIPLEHRALVAEYLDRFNRRDWDGVKALVRADVEVAVVGRAGGVGPEFIGRRYSTNYERLPFEWRYAIVDVDGSPQAVLFALEGEAWTPHSILALAFEDGLVVRARDYIHVEYMLDESQVELPDFAAGEA